MVPLDASLLGHNQTLIPLIEFQDVPITVALENLALQAGVDYLLDPQIGYGQPDEHGHVKPEPVMSCTWEKVTAKQGLMAILKNYDFTIDQDPASPIVLVRANHHPAHLVDATLAGNDSQVIPLIKFEDVPLSTALENLSKQANLKCTVQLPWPNASTGAPEPIIAFRAENITAKAAFISLCENYDLTIVKDPAAGAVEVKSDH